MPSVALHVVEFTFLSGFDSFRAHHITRTKHGSSHCLWDRLLRPTANLEFIQPDGALSANTTFMPWPLADVQVGIVSEAGDRYFIAAGYIEAEFAQAEIDAGLGPAIEDSPTVTVFDLVDEFRGADADLQRAVTFLVVFIVNDDLVSFLAVANHRAVKVVVVQLEEDVVFGVGVVEHPLQEVTLFGHRRKSEGARGGNGFV